MSATIGSTRLTEDTKQDVAMHDDSSSRREPVTVDVQTTSEKSGPRTRIATIDLSGLGQTHEALIGRYSLPRRIVPVAQPGKVGAAGRHAEGRQGLAVRVRLVG